MPGHDAIDARAPVKNWRYSIERHDDRSQIGGYRIHDFFGASCSMAHIPNGRRAADSRWKGEPDSARPKNLRWPAGLVGNLGSWHRTRSACCRARRVRCAARSWTEAVSESAFVASRWFTVSALGRGTPQAALGRKQQSQLRPAAAHTAITHVATSRFRFITLPNLSYAWARCNRRSRAGEELAV